MRTTHPSKSLFLVSLLASGTILSQMGLYAVSLLAGWDVRLNFVAVCHSALKWIGLTFFEYAVDALVFSTLILFVWKISRQWLLASRLRRWFGAYEISTLTSEWSKRYSADIRLISYPAPVAVTMGFFRPVVVLSTGLKDMLTDSEFEAVVYHELYHHRSRDPLKVFLLAVSASVLWYMPILGWVREQYRRDKELLADAYAIERTGSAAELGSALVKMIKAGRQIHMPLSCVSFADTSVNERIHRLLNPAADRPLHIPVQSAFWSLSVFAGICLLFIDVLL
ncbi:M56 family metallopeptidase [Domibacillus sp. PGB-M46]|uniref:M56 family metallopeptidase n=1 Tax=Domibacillus sp. PGB-M46 TaxID=2910255 RepID=UPI001F588647|nr:M56 family metallopeptidase [Domibacillus sp. PGB-M46]MCI2252837.1 M56 family metallopeptidase [Domibacillus sp. PGB-M46]